MDEPNEEVRSHADFSVDRLVSGQNTEVIRWLDALEDAMLGHPLYYTRNEPPEATPLEALGLRKIEDDSSRTISRRVGYVLPLNDDDSTHIIIGLDGMLAITRVREEEASVPPAVYKQYFGSLGSGISQEGSASLDQHPFDRIRELSYLGFEITDGRIPENLTQVTQALDTALEVAQRRKEKIEAAKRESLKTVIGKLSRFFDEDSGSGE